MRLGLTKDPEQSLRRREEGNNFFQGGDLQSALVSYTRAVVLGEDSTPDLASAFANRAACLQRLGHPEYALTDLELAADNGYETANMFKLLERRAQCLLSLKRFEEARDAFEEALASLKVAKLDKKKKDKFLKDIKTGLAKIESEKTVVSSTETESRNPQSDLILSIGT